MAESKGCTMLCQPTTLTAEQSTQLAKLISEEYHVHMYVVLDIIALHPSTIYMTVLISTDRAVFILVSKSGWFCINYVTRLA